MPTVNERCKILRSLNRVYVFEIVLLLVPRLKILRGLSITDFGFQILRNKEAQEYKSSCQEKTTTSGSQLGGGEITSRSIFDAISLIWISIYNGAILGRCSYAALHQRQTVSK